ncbi:acyl-CoA synthetase (AMP-forming)/AMP-acid ligase II [Saccharothrix tamanrassetensis]|uniref:Acyl-CoA synthetase (AMP-forming)/AMP-acid ligase II n=1 Tax=Saccharothrix tamanrassetensis TaxID=1051531 RepID=A0A841C9Y9_9PSEU|nr:class I adenylate-forming enzyme family protein [Saccharothrix tamanrassetensis]MBB5953780.1 acyl-CoA synthetase (AMP-forming)/AMP-acid ligase II [Saccharothrix tamanrassetensis]
MGVPATSLVVPDLLRRRVEQQPDQQAINVEGKTAITYGDWDLRSNAVARGLLARGHGRGTRIALLFGGSDWIDYAIAYLGVLKAGATAVHTNDTYPQAELDRRFGQCGVAGIIQGSALPLQRAAPERWVATLRDFEPLSTGPVDVDVRPEDISDILYTSGTTGPAKPFTNPHGTLTHGRGSAALGKLENPEPLLAPMPLGTTSSSTTVAVLATTTPAPLIVCRPDEPDRLLELLADHGCGTLILTPHTAIRLTALRPQDRYDLGTVKVIGNASAPMPPRVARQLKEAMPNAEVSNAYAQSEAVPAIVMGVCDPDRPMAVGKPAKGTELLIADERGEAVAPGELGEVWMRSPAPKRLYLDEELNRQVHRDGWTRTRDLGRVGPDGELLLFDRMVDAIATGGRLVSSLEVEAAVYDHPKVREAAVIGLPDPDLGRAVTAVVVAEGGLTQAELSEFLTGRLEPHQLPTRVHSVESLPRGGTGKVLKFRLRQELG